MNRFRQQRMDLFLACLKQLQARPITILDIGGRKQFWKDTSIWNDASIRVHIINVKEGDDIDDTENILEAPNIARSTGDGCDLSTVKQVDFDVIFSNSVIEHVGALDRQQTMANEVLRTGKKYWIQTPNKFFPIEPHFRMPFFFLIPRWLKIFLIRHFDLGCFSKEREYDKAVRKLDSVRLLTKNQLRRLFPEGTILEERLLGLTKSFVVHNFEL